MTALETRQEIQKVLGVNPDGNIGPATLAALHSLVNTPDADPWPIVASEPVAWPFSMHIDGEDLVSDENIVITCFGGNGDGTNSDPQDNGDTASGLNTNLHPWVGVSVAMDGRQFPHLSNAEHAALDGSPIPKMPFGTLVQLTISGTVFEPKDGIIDLGPGRQASRPGSPHALDLTVSAAKLVSPGHSNDWYANEFELRGQLRIVGGAKYLQSNAA